MAVKKLSKNNGGIFTTSKDEPTNAQFFCRDATRGLSEYAPFDKIIAAAALEDKIPEAWKHQLKIGGRIVAPVRESIMLLIKKDDKTFETQGFPGFAFVPFVK